MIVYNTSSLMVYAFNYDFALVGGKIGFYDTGLYLPAFVASPLNTFDVRIPVTGGAGAQIRFGPLGAPSLASIFVPQGIGVSTSSATQYTDEGPVQMAIVGAPITAGKFTVYIQIYLPAKR
jgi:hypothetical protein